MSDDAQPQIDSPLDEMKKFTERQEAAAKLVQEERIKMEKAATHIALSGKSVMAPPPAPVDPHAEWVRKTNEKYKGTILEGKAA